MPQFHGNFPLRQRKQNFVVARKLEIRERLVRFVRLREMRHHAFEPQRFLGTNLFDERQRLVPAHAIAAHAGVNFQMHRHPFAVGGGDLRQLANGMQFVHANGQVVLDAPREFGFLPFAQQQQRRGDARVTKHHRLFERAQAESPRAFLQRNLRHVERAMAVRLVLHDGEQPHIFRQVTADELQVAAQPAEVNLGPRGAQRKSCRIEIHKTLGLFNHESCQMARKISSGIRFDRSAEHCSAQTNMSSLRSNAPRSKNARTRKNPCNPGQTLPGGHKL